jgi:hypothetical protein
MGIVEEMLRVFSRKRRRERSTSGLELVDWERVTQVVVHVRPMSVSVDRDLILSDEQGDEVIVPLKVAETTGAIGRLQSLPGFNLEKYARALTTEVEDFVVCWRA